MSAAVVFLLSDAPAYITGHELLVAGGSDLVHGLLEQLCTTVSHHSRDSIARLPRQL